MDQTGFVCTEWDIWGMFGIDGMQVAYTFLSLHWYTATPVQYFS